MLIEQAGAGTLTVLTITGDAETWDVTAEDGIGWVKQDDGSLDIFMRATLAVATDRRDLETMVVASFGQGAWQCVRWEAANGDSSEERA